MSEPRMTTANWVRLIEKEMKRRTFVTIPVQKGETAKSLRNRLAYYKRKLGKPWRFNVDAFGNCVTVRR